MVLWMLEVGPVPAIAMSVRWRVLVLVLVLVLLFVLLLYRDAEADREAALRAGGVLGGDGVVVGRSGGIYMY